MYFLNIVTAMLIGSCDFLFLLEDGYENKLFANLRSYSYTCINLLWWGDSILILVAIVHIRKYSSSDVSTINGRQLILHLIVCVLFGICSIPICVIQLFDSTYYGKFFFIMQTVQTTIAGVAILIMFWIFNNICS